MPAVQEALPGHAGARNQGASPTSGTFWPAARNPGAGWVLLGQCRGGTSRARNAAICPGKGKGGPSAWGSIAVRPQPGEDKAGLPYWPRAVLAVGVTVGLASAPTGACPLAVLAVLKCL